MNHRGSHTHDGTGRGVFTAALAVVAALAMSSACKEKEDVKLPKPPEFSLDSTVAKMAPLALDDGFFTALQDLEKRAMVEGSDPALMATVMRFQLDGLAAGLVSGHPAGARILGGNIKDANKVGRFLTDLATRAGAAQQKELAGMLTAAGDAYGKGPGQDLAPVFATSLGDQPASPALRLILAHRLLGAVLEAASGSESLRGKVVSTLLPGFPSPPTQDLESTVFPSAMKMLAVLLKRGPGKEAGLAPHFDNIAARATRDLGSKAITMPVALTASPRPGTPLAGVMGGYDPLLVLSLIKDSAKLGARPVFTWKDGAALNASATPGWPGNVVASMEELADTRNREALFTRVAADIQQMEIELAPLEGTAYQNRFEAGTVVLNADREERGHAALVAVDGKVEAEAMGHLLAMANAAGLNDLRLVQPGEAGRVLPVLYRKVPKIPGVKAPKGDRALVVISRNGAELYPPARKGGSRLPKTGWPEGTRVVVDQKRFFKLVIPWTEEEGYGRALKGALETMRQKTSIRPLLDVVVLTRDVVSVRVLDAVAEVEAVEGEPFADLKTWFPGVECPDGSTCPGLVPVLFSGTRVPRPSRPEVEVKETRPAGFCDKKAVARVMRGRSGAYRACYEVQLQRKPELSGRIQVRFTIEPNGSVSGVKVLKNELNSKVGSCIVKQVSTLRFPKPDGGVCVIRWPFKFQPGG
ncbi:MAG: energy transducer TonB [Deltaproteobacteria bacterium]|nr:energy transducer TonB [Deltaproteobacteria bacterium]